MVIILSERELDTIIWMCRRSVSIFGFGIQSGLALVISFSVIVVLDNQEGLLVITLNLEKINGFFQVAGFRQIVAELACILAGFRQEVAELACFLAGYR